MADEEALNKRLDKLAATVQNLAIAVGKLAQVLEKERTTPKGPPISKHSNFQF